MLIARTSPASCRAASSSISMMGARTLTAMCRSNSSTLKSPKASNANRAALLTSKRTGGSAAAPLKIASRQPTSARSATTLTAPGGTSAVSRRTCATTAQPSLSNARAISAPTRLPVPVTIAVRSAMQRTPALSSAAKQSNDERVPESHKPIDIRAMSLAELQKLIAARRLPPVDQWNPQHCGHSGMRIARDGTWYHEGEPIRRAEMVRLFSTVLRREPDGTHVLVTPAEKLDIDVETTPFRAIAMHREGEGRDQLIAFSL